jgi:hypothetical protein
LEKNRDKLFTFLSFDGVPWNNNNAEHAVKHFAALRRIIEGITSEKGIRDYLVLLSICETCKYMGLDFLDFLRSGENVGQPELDEKLDSIELRQLKQRIALRSQLQSLDLEETRGYIQRRLQLAGANCNSTVLFPADTIVRIHRHSRGIPRLINTVCENALITAYARQARSVTPDIIEDIAADFRLGVVHQPN